MKYANGAIGQFEVSWSFRGGMELRDEVMGIEGTICANNFLRIGFELFSTDKSVNYVAEKAESSSAWLFTVGDEVHDWVIIICSLICLILLTKEHNRQKYFMTDIS
ncbi:MAG: hypothetical protein JSS70_19685 [Bacteroidetes bacterium]|nr:hypothetical protein [Bacteroidota bacterium]